MPKPSFRFPRIVMLQRAALVPLAALGLSACTDVAPVKRGAGDAKVAGAISGEKRWWRVDEGRTWDAQMRFIGDTTDIDLARPSGAVDTTNHPFFSAIGTNGRACISCHQPSDGMGLSTRSIQEQWRATKGRDPLFAAIDGMNCPNLPRDDEASYSLLLKRGLFRVPVSWPPKPINGEANEISIEVVNDPTGCNTDAIYGIKGENATVSVFRRPRPVANLRYIMTVPNLFNIKTGVPVDRDPETGERVSMNLMSDARLPTLRAQARDAAIRHLERKEPLSEAQLRAIVSFESDVYMTGSHSRSGGALDAAGATAGTASIIVGKPLLGDYITRRLMPYFDAWNNLKPGEGNQTEREFRASVARGEEIFMMRPFYIRDVTHLNTIIGMGNPIKRTCATCHNMQHTGIDGAPGWMDLGVNTLPYANKTADLPMFRITCSPKARPHPYLGRTIFTTDPGRALVTGKCVDVGAITLQQMRGLAERAPYFANGSADTLMEVVEFYDRRFEMKLSEQDKRDLVNFMGAL